MAPLEPWEKVLVDAETFPETVHGQLACTACHGGNADGTAMEKEAAHEGLVADPSLDAQTSCGECHPNVLAMNEHSLHNTQEGYWTVLNARMGTSVGMGITDADAQAADDDDEITQQHEAIGVMFNNHCASCHAACGDCHVSQPGAVGGGLIDGHNFNATPSMTRNCTACHGSRVGNEYLGKHESLMADVHFRQGRMSCVDCHSGEEMHGQTGNCEACHAAPEGATLPPPDHRYDGVQSPRCETCHVTASVGSDGVEMHAVHGADLSCQVCHSIAYSSCDGCHVQVSQETGVPFFRTDGSYLTFFIGRNPRKSFDRPYDYVPVRHVPIAESSFTFYGPDLLPFFEALPTWAYATPHNIQRETPQNESCEACHDNESLFLTADKVAPHELDANRPVIVDAIPAPITPTLTITSTQAITSTAVSP